MQRTLFWLATLGLLAGTINVRGDNLVFQSSQTKTHLLELFTSEGCSSCPPAEAWLSKLKGAAGLWHDFVPVAFHVDYWDNLGWRDPFASKEWTARQYQYSANWNSGSVYTPAFVLDGREWQPAGVPPSLARETPGVLRIVVENPDTVRATFRPASANAQAMVIHVAKLGFGINSRVKAGENNGRKLQHDFVVLSLASEELPNEFSEVVFHLDNSKLAANSPGAVAAWVTQNGRAEPIQAVGGWLHNEVPEQRN
jgi:hypothetical protein